MIEFSSFLFLVYHSFRCINQCVSDIEKMLNDCRYSYLFFSEPSGD